MDLENLNAALRIRSEPSWGPEREIERFDDLMGVMTALTAQSIAGGRQMDAEVNRWFIDKLKESAEKLSQYDNLFTRTMRGSISHNRLWDRITRARVILISLGEVELEN